MSFNQVIRDQGTNQYTSQGMSFSNKNSKVRLPPPPSTPPLKNTTKTSRILLRQLCLFALNPLFMNEPAV